MDYACVRDEYDWCKLGTYHTVYKKSEVVGIRSSGST